MHSEDEIISSSRGPEEEKEKISNSCLLNEGYHGTLARKWRLKKWRRSGLLDADQWEKVWRECRREMKIYSILKVPEIITIKLEGMFGNS